jgi:hypothetical protein
MRFARLIERRVQFLGVPSVRVVCGGDLQPALVATQRGAAWFP